MVQSKVANNKQPPKPNTKSSIQNHDTKTKGADLKAIKMKKSRLIKLSDSEVSLCLSSKGREAPRKPPTVLTPSPCKASSYTFPNYMKSTTSSEARNERKNKASTPKLHKVAKTCSLKKVRTLTKAPSFKHTRTSTCSSTIKDSKFPPYLELEPGATEAQGNSLLRVCSYNYCSLNGHHHSSAPPLKRFISSRRRQLKSQKVDIPEVLTPRKRNPYEDTIKDFFIENFVRDKEVATQISESLSDGPCSEIDFQDNIIDQNEDTSLSEMNFVSEGGCTLSTVQNQTSFESELEVESSPSVSSDEFFCENSDIEWEEGQIYGTNDNIEILTESHCNDDKGKPGFGGYFDEFHQYPPYFEDEIVEFLWFSDDGDSIAETDKEVIEGAVMEEKDEMHSATNNEVGEEKSNPSDEAIIHATKLEDEFDVKQGEILSNLIEEVTKAQNEGLKSYKEPLELDADESEEDKYMTGEIREENTADRVMEEEEEEEREPIKETINDMSQISETSGAFSAKGETCTANNDGQNNSSEAKLHSHEDNVVEEKTSEMGEINSTKVDEAPETKNKLQEPTQCNSNNGKSFSNQEFLESCNKSKRVTRCRKENKDVEEEREFNPRGPNFLDLEPDPEAEKVDLRHQEMDDRRNAEEWMLDYALQKTVNQLAPARKKKVALLVEAFEAVLPVTKYESYSYTN